MHTEPATYAFINRVDKTTGSTYCRFVVKLYQCKNQTTNQWCTDGGRSCINSYEQVMDKLLNTKQKVHMQAKVHRIGL